MQWTIRRQLLVGFGVMLVLLAAVTLIGQWQLAGIKHLNEELDSRALRLSLASNWNTQVQIAVATKTAVPGLDIESVRKLNAITQDAVEKSSLSAATGSQAGLPEAHSEFIGKLVGKLVELQIRDSGALQSTLSTAAGALWGMLAVGLVVGVLLALKIASSIVGPINRAAQVADRVAHGDLSSPIEEGGSNEVGAMMNSLSTMQENLANLVAQCARGLAKRGQCQRRDSPGQ